MEPDNTRAYFEWKRGERLGYRLNKPVKGPRGLARLVAIAEGRQPHSLYCDCRECIPPEVEAWMRSKPHLFPQYALQEQEKPVVGEWFSGNRGFKPPRWKWDERCSTCAGAGEIRDLKGNLIPCPRCSEEA